MKTERKEQFTPGPWFIETVHVGDEKWDEIRDKDGNFIAESGNYLDSDPEPHPDSILQKAAPEMYSELRDCAGAMAEILALIVEGKDVPDTLIAMAQDEVDNAAATLKKARGEA